jgi:hypothetical protein
MLYWRRRGLTIPLLVVIVLLIFWFALVPDLVRLAQPARSEQSRIADVERKVTNGRQGGGKAGDGALRGMPPGNSFFKGESGALSLYTTRDGQLNEVGTLSRHSLENLDPRHRYATTSVTMGMSEALAFRLIDFNWLFSDSNTPQSNHGNLEPDSPNHSNPYIPPPNDLYPLNSSLFTITRTSVHCNRLTHLLLLLRDI